MLRTLRYHSVVVLDRRYFRAVIGSKLSSLRVPDERSRCICEDSLIVSPLCGSMYYAPAVVDLLEEIVARPNSVDGAAAVWCALSLFGTAGLVLFGVVWPRHLGSRAVRGKGQEVDARVSAASSGAQESWPKLDCLREKKMKRKQVTDINMAALRWR